MAKPIDMELKKAFAELQAKMIKTTKKIQCIDIQINVFKSLLHHVDVTQSEISNLPPKTKTYESIGRMFLFMELDDVKCNLKKRESQLKTFSTELENNKKYLERNLKESEDNLREMVQQKKEQSDTKTN